MVIEYERIGNYAIAKLDGSAKELADFSLAVQERAEIKVDAQLDGKSIVQLVSKSVGPSANEQHQGQSAYQSEYLRKKAEKEERRRAYWAGVPAGPEGNAAVDISEIKNVLGAINLINLISYSRDTADTGDFLVSYDVMQNIREILQHYEKLLANEPLVRQIADEWHRAGAFSEGPEGVS